MDHLSDGSLHWLRRLPARQRFAAVAAGTVLVTALGGAAWAATGTSGGTTPPGTSSTTPSTPNTTPGTPGRGFGHGWGGRGGMPGMGMAGTIHGQFTVPKSGGGYETLATQRGTVEQAPTSTTITVKSADGFTQTYTVTPTTLVNAEAAGIASISKGDTVLVTATVGSSGDTAVSIIDPSLQSAARQQWAPQFSRPGGSAPNAPAPNGGSSGGTGNGAASFLGTV